MFLTAVSLSKVKVGGQKAQLGCIKSCSPFLLNADMNHRALLGQMTIIQNAEVAASESQSYGKFNLFFAA